MSKWQIIIIAIISALVIGLGLSLGYTFHKLSILNDELSQAKAATAIAQSGIQQLNNKLGIAESKLIAKNELIDKYQNELNNLPIEFKNITQKYKLELESRDKVIAQLKGKINGGTTEVVVQPPAPSANSEHEIIQYSWQDPHKRFHLIDPDIFTKNNEIFEYKQQVAITGYIYADETGEIKIRKLTLQEVVPNDDDTGYTPITSTNIEIVDNKFEYIKPSIVPKSIWDVWHPRLFASFDTQLYPGIGLEPINFGRYIDYLNIGSYVKVAANTTGGLKGLKSSSIGIGLSYQLIPPFLDTNLAVGVALSTPMDKFLNQYILTIDAIFYLTN